MLLIKHIRQRATAKGRDSALTLELILQNVVGIDLNPLAVIAARTNYLLALGDLMKSRKGDIDIPVYQADSVLTPSRGSDLFEADSFPLKTSAGVFRVPAAFSSRERMDVLANVLDESVEAGIAEGVFLARVTEAAQLETEEVAAAKAGLVGLYQQLQALHASGVNGVWARIIKNAFAPLFLEPCHYVVGNPPWVNWEHLPDDYRRSTMPLWVHYGLFPKRLSGMETILGAAKYDFSSLMTYVALDKYLRPRGKLGFVLTQTLFKTAGAAQGFRRFTLPDGTPCGPMLVEDMVKLKPFEGAANRTAVAVFAKGHRVSYPVSYSYWVKRASGRGSGIGFDDPYETVTSELITYRRWFAEPVDAADASSPWLTARRRALRALRLVAGPSSYRARKGITCSANAVFWLERIGERPGGSIIVSNVIENAKRRAERVQAAIEADLVYPLMRGKDVARWRATSELSVLLTHEPGMRLKAIPEEEMQQRFPKAWTYLTRFRSLLSKSGIMKRYFGPTDPFYSTFNVGDYTFANHKVVWREVSNDLECAVVGVVDGKPVIPDHTLTLAAAASAKEAHYLCAMLNSAPARLFVRSYVALHPSPHVLKNVRIQSFNAKTASHVRLAQLSVEAHEATLAGDESRVQEIEREIDEGAARLWKLEPEDVEEITASLAEA